jgi:hypothetical protein
MQYRRSVQGRMILTELETSARTESKRMTNHNTPQLSRMGLPVHCATFSGLSRLNTRAVVNSEPRRMPNHVTATSFELLSYHLFVNAEEIHEEFVRIICMGTETST